MSGSVGPDLWGKRQESDFKSKRTPSSIREAEQWNRGFANDGQRVAASACFWPPRRRALANRDGVTGPGPQRLQTQGQ